mmetsp:Transcript_15452/g.36923  ORF Transcript_15452/g.36923 Transcript_15452/m.36923 type:complete len:205 (+) Transcript_15452:138-752(+)
MGSYLLPNLAELFVHDFFQNHLHDGKRQHGQECQHRLERHDGDVSPKLAPQNQRRHDARHSDPPDQYGHVLSRWEGLDGIHDEHGHDGRLADPKGPAPKQRLHVGIATAAAPPPHVHQHQTRHDDERRHHLEGRDLSHRHGPRGLPDPVGDEAHERARREEQQLVPADERRGQPQGGGPDGNLNDGGDGRAGQVGHDGIWTTGR